MTNCSFLRAEWPNLFAEASRAERTGLADPWTCCCYARRCLELTVGWLYDADATLTPPYREDLPARLWEPSLKRLASPGSGLPKTSGSCTFSASSSAI